MDQLPPLPPTPSSVASSPIVKNVKANYLPYFIAIVFLISIISTLFIYQHYFLKPTKKTTLTSSAYTPPPSDPEKPLIFPPTTTPIKTTSFKPTIRIDIGSASETVDSIGQHWQPDINYCDGLTAEYPNGKYFHTATPEIFKTERYGLNYLSYPISPGKYQIILYFAESYPYVTAPKQRLFDAKVEDTLLSNIDIFYESGGLHTAVTRTALVNVLDNSLDIAFISRSDNATGLSGLEIIPQ